MCDVHRPSCLYDTKYSVSQAGEYILIKLSKSLSKLGKRLLKVIIVFFCLGSGAEPQPLGDLLLFRCKMVTLHAEKLHNEFVLTKQHFFLKIFWGGAGSGGGA